MNSHEHYMQRCLQLAALGSGYTAPNPMVGAVLVHQDRIIGEGYHRQYGGPHAEVNCINSVAQEDGPLINQSTLYVSLEPCAHYGKTPPCADLIIHKRIPRVIIACRDPFEAVNGKGIEKLTAAGIQTTTGILEKQAIELNKRFFCFHQLHRPYVILKWAQTSDHIIGSLSDKRLLISDELTNKKVHRWRSEESGILIGTNTALKDNPSLTNRLWSGASPLRIVIDKNLQLSPALDIFKEYRTVIFNTVKEEEKGNLLYLKIHHDGSWVKNIAKALFELNVQSILVEGGAYTLQTFIDSRCWDEARVITNTGLNAGECVKAPHLYNGLEEYNEWVGKTRIDYFINPSPQPL